VKKQSPSPGVKSQRSCRSAHARLPVRGRPRSPRLTCPGPPKSAPPATAWTATCLASPIPATRGSRRASPNGHAVGGCRIRPSDELEVGHRAAGEAKEVRGRGCGLALVERKADRRLALHMKGAIRPQTTSGRSPHVEDDVTRTSRRSSGRTRSRTSDGGSARTLARRVGKPATASRERRSAPATAPG
jgi:hypothetical protein